MSMFELFDITSSKVKWPHCNDYEQLLESYTNSIFSTYLLLIILDVTADQFWYDTSFIHSITWFKLTYDNNP